MGDPEAVQMAQLSAVASPQLIEGDLFVPQQLVDGINITADTHSTFPLGAEVAMDEQGWDSSAFTRISMEQKL